MQTPSLKPNPDLMPTACLVPKRGPRLLIVGMTGKGQPDHCTRCGERGVTLTGGLYWQRRGQPRRAQYLMCASCEKRFKTSGPVQERFFKRLEEEAPIFPADVERHLPEIEGRYSNPQVRYLYFCGMDGEGGRSDA